MAVKRLEKKGKKSSSFGKKLFVFLFVFIVLGAAGGVAAGFLLYNYVKTQIPHIETIADYKPKTGTKVYSYDGELIAEFYDGNKRSIVAYDKIPKQLRNAFIAAEDAEFYHHKGVDPVSMLRAAVKTAMGNKQGGSTITQQLAKAFVGNEQTITRKLKDIVLALELEKYLSKEEILYLYLNEIFLGSGAYGVESAARVYFSKHVWELSIAEMATLAGLPKYPSKASPIHHPDTAKKRRDYVLEQMLDKKFITKEEYTEAKSHPVIVNPMKELMLDKVPHFSERVRRYLQQTYGDKKLYEEGMTVYTTVDVRASKLANEAMFMGLRALGMRQGYLGVLYHIDLQKELKTYLEKHLKAFGAITEKNIIRGKYYQGVVLSVEDKQALVQVGEVKKPILLDNLTWARPWEPLGNSAPPKKVADVLTVGDVIVVRATDKDGTKDVEDHRRIDKPLTDGFYFAIEQVPSVEGAIIVKDPYSGYVKALMGGYDFEKSEFDRTTQACRQPGSSIKPLFYAAAIDKLPGGKKKDPKAPAAEQPKEGETKPQVESLSDSPITAATILLDAPIASVDYQPSDYDEGFKGEVTVWEAIIHSLNAPAVRLVQEIGLSYAIQTVQNFGIKSEIKRELGSALGSSCVNLDEITDAYSLFPNEGRKPFTTFIRKVFSSDGKLLEDNTVFYDPFLSGAQRINRLISGANRKEEQKIAPETAYIMTKTMEDVCIYGTAGSAASLGRHIGGKTGTTNDYFDAWFIGFSPEIVAGVWVGHDKHGIQLGRDETGGKAALPIWKDFMGRYLANFPKTDFKKPENVTSALIDRKTGFMAPQGQVMYFKAGTEPVTKEENQVIDPSKMQDSVF